MLCFSVIQLQRILPLPPVHALRATSLKPWQAVQA